MLAPWFNTNAGESTIQWKDKYGLDELVISKLHCAPQRCTDTIHTNLNCTSNNDAFRSRHFACYVV